MNAKFDYSLYVIPPGEEIFAPNGLYPTHPAITILRKTLEYTVIHLKKQTSIKQGKSCNAAKDYKYGGSRSTFDYLYFSFFKFSYCYAYNHMILKCHI